LSSESFEAGAGGPQVAIKVVLPVPRRTFSFSLMEKRRKKKKKIQKKKKIVLLLLLSELFVV
jgi:hypothetical protein